MFEVAELGRTVDKATFEAEAQTLRTALLDAQRALAGTRRSVVVIVSGVEGARKSEVVNRLGEWLDPRGLWTHAFWNETEDERIRPRAWRFWQRLPPRGTIGVMFGSWYTRPIVQRALGEIDDETFAHQMDRVAEFERTLALDGTLVVKLWFHLSKDAQIARLEALEDRPRTDEADERRGEKKRKKRKKAKGGKKARAGKRARGAGDGRASWKLSPLVERFAPLYETFARISARAIRMTDSGLCPWHIVEAEDRRHRDLTAGRHVLDALRAAERPVEAAVEPVESAPPARTVLDAVDLERRIDPDDYAARLAAEQKRLNGNAWALRDGRRSVVCVFEGWDAAGKGGAIRRITAAVDARLYRVVPIAAPTDEERAQHYLWRFWRHVPPPGRVRIFDRSWYGRVLVERVEGFASRGEWSRAYREINGFEEQLVEGGIGICKFWIHISPEEQLRRFEERAQVPWKAHKITDEDWRNREKWPAYAHAIHDMVARTSTDFAPWTLVPGNDKRLARVEILRTVNETIERTLAGDP